MSSEVSLPVSVGVFGKLTYRRREYLGILVSAVTWTTFRLNLGKVKFEWSFAVFSEPVMVESNEKDNFPLFKRCGLKLYESHCDGRMLS